jgi:hypothetical protein
MIEVALTKIKKKKSIRAHQTQIMHYVLKHLRAHTQIFLDVYLSMYS